MLPQTHKIISEHVHCNIKEKLGVELNINSLIYGSIKPDIAPSLIMMDHFKPQSFDYVCKNIFELSQYNLTSNKECIKLISRQLGIVTHFISDFFCVPHNDRKTYKNNFINHIKYESKLHNHFKSFKGKIEVPKSMFNMDNRSPYPIKNFIDNLHKQYSLKGESLANDIENSIRASSAVGLFIIYHAIQNRQDQLAA